MNGRLILGTVLFLGAGFLFWIETQKPQWTQSISQLIAEARAASFDLAKWEALRAKSETELPPIWPLSNVSDSLRAAERIISELNQAQQTDFEFDPIAGTVRTDRVLALWDHLAIVEEELKTIESEVATVPRFLLPEARATERDEALLQIQKARELAEDLLKFRKILERAVEQEDRILILLQNQNEPRSTGGFTGSVVLVDFNPETISFQFRDIYALDRLVSVESQLPAPQFFHPLSKTISLRDANFFPHFPTTAETYRTFFSQINEKAPQTVMAVNLNILRELMSIVGPMTLQPWGVTVDRGNVDTGLQFLVESKVAGRFAVKEPLLKLAEQILTRLRSLTEGETDRTAAVRQILFFDWESFLSGKNILVHSRDEPFQNLMEKWDLAGYVRRKAKADNFLYTDFVSVGANKSEKFLQTKLWHDSEIAADGAVVNTLEIRRAHTLTDENFDNLLRTENLPPNLKDLLNEELRFKLGDGENRTVLRIYVPLGAQLLSARTRSGPINQTLSADQQFTVFEIPMFVIPGETAVAKLQYQTQIGRGSSNWRPYFFQIVGPPGRDQTQFLSTISTAEGGQFRAETQNIGRPQVFQDMDVRAVVDFR